MQRLEPGVALSMPRAEVAPVDMGGVPSERVVAHGAAAAHAILLVHGGAFAVGTPALYRGLAARLSRAADCAVFVPDYRLAPEHRFPAALDDTHRAWEWLDTRQDRARAAIIGDSAGGGLALALLGALGASGLGWSEVEVVRQDRDAPTLRLHGRAASAALALGVTRISLTLSHEPTWCIGQVLLEGGP